MNDCFDIGYTCLNVFIVNTSTIISSIAQKNVIYFCQAPHISHIYCRIHYEMRNSETSTEIYSKCNKL